MYIQSTIPLKSLYQMYKQIQNEDLYKYESIYVTIQIEDLKT